MAEAKSYLDKEGLALTVSKLKSYADNNSSFTAKYDGESLILTPIERNKIAFDDSALKISVRTDEKMKASHIEYSNSASPSGVTTVQAALDELYSLLTK